MTTTTAKEPSSRPSITPWARAITPWILGTLVALTAACGDGDGGTDTSDAFTFRTDLPSAYQRGDRVGMPFIGTFFIFDKNGYNLDSPADDVMLVDGQPTWTGELVASTSMFSGALMDDFQNLSLAQCADFSSQVPDSSPCLSQEIVQSSTVAELVIPDTITIDAAQPGVFPNGRELDVGVIDRTLAMLLLDLAFHPVDALAAIPLNPTSNDVEFLSDFPYLAEPHER